MSKNRSALDPDVLEFESALMRSIDQAEHGEGRVTSPASILVRRAGRPTGTVKAAPKVSTTIRLSADVVEAFKSAGDGWQTRIDAALKDWLRIHHQI